VSWFLIAVIVLVGVGLAARRWWQSQWRLLSTVYRTVDEHIGAVRSEAQHNRTMQFWWGWAFGENAKQRLWPLESRGGIMPTPSPRRMNRYVELVVRDGVRRPRFGHDVDAVVIKWSTEAGQWMGDRWYEVLERRVAQALGYAWHEHLFSQARDVTHSTVRLTVNRTSIEHAVPGQLDATEELR
jgi:hypothetical protein